MFIENIPLNKRPNLPTISHAVMKSILTISRN